jgi:uncharacterized protein
VIDAAVHHRWASEAEVYPFLEEGWRRYVGEPRSIAGRFGARRLLPIGRYPNPVGEDLPGAAAEGAVAGASVDALGERWLDDNSIDRALLVYDRGTFAASHPNPFFAAAVVRAVNDWNAETWLCGDERLHGVALVPEQSPDEAVAELHRVAANPRIAAVAVSPSIGRLLGHPLYHPIYEAAAELGLPVVINRGIDAITDAPTGTAGGAPYTFAEYRTLAPLALTTNITSIVVNGVFERYPALRLYASGAGITWLDAMFLRVDTLWRSLRSDFPWVKEAPSEYLRRGLRVGTYGIEAGAPDTIRRLAERKPHLREMLVYGSGWPRWDTTGPREVAELLPTDWHEEVFTGNAAGWFRWESRVAAR